MYKYLLSIILFSSCIRTYDNDTSTNTINTYIVEHCSDRSVDTIKVKNGRYIHYSKNGSYTIISYIDEKGLMKELINYCKIVEVNIDTLKNE